VHLLNSDLRRVAKAAVTVALVAATGGEGEVEIAAADAAEVAGVDAAENADTRTAEHAAEECGAAASERR
jgi:hypothetical protein